MAALIRGARNGSCLLLLCGWSFPLPQRWWRLRLVLRSEVAPFFTLACICQAIIAPWGRLLPEQRKENSNQSHDAQPVFLSSACRGVEFTSMSDADERVVVCFRNGWVFHATAGRRQCHGTRRLPTGWRRRLYFRSTELNFTQICCEDDEKYYTVGVFTLHCQECTFFFVHGIRVFVCFRPLECPWSVFDVARCRKGALV